MGYYGLGHSMTGYYGDPSFWGALKGAVVGYVTSGFNPAGAVVGAVGGSMGSGSSGRAASPSAPMPGGVQTPQPTYGPMPFAGAQYPRSTGARGGGIGHNVPRVGGHPVLTGAAQAATAIYTGGPVGGISTAAAAGSLPGYTRGHVMTRGGGWRRRPHMRVTNPKALHRALRRAHGFKKLALKTIRLVDPHRKARVFAGFKHHRRAKK